MKAKKQKLKKRAKQKPNVDPRLGSVIGLSKGEKVAAVWNRLLQANFRLKYTDEGLAEAFKREFPRRKTIQPVGRIRSFYNRGLMGLGDNEGKRSKKPSVAYDKDGNETITTSWGQGKKVNAERSKIARKRALKQWAAAAKGKKPVAKPGKGKKTAGKKTAAKKPEKTAAAAKPAKKKIKLKIAKKAA